MFLWLYLHQRLKINHCAIILMYHRIVSPEERDFLFKNSSVHHDLTSLNNELSFLAKWVNVISMDDLVQHIVERKPFSKPTVVLTFDDGYRDNYDLAFPLLKQYSMPATIYVTTGLTGTSEKIWTDQIEFALLSTESTVLQFPDIFGDQALGISTHYQKCSANIKISKILKKMKDEEKKLLINKLYRSLSLDPIGMYKTERTMLNEAELLEMSNHGIDFGAHTDSHPILPLQSIEMAKQELEKSKHKLERILGRQVKHFAIPNGKAKDFSESLKKHAVELGFESIATTEYGCVTSTSDQFFLRRTSPSVPFETFACGIAKMFFLSNRVDSGSGSYG